MKIDFKKYIIISLAFFLIFLTGCWDRSEPEDEALFIVGGYDYNPETNMYKIFGSIENMSFEGGGSGAGNDAPPFWVVSAWGETSTDAIANISKKISKNINYNHLHLLLLSETIVQNKGIIPVMDSLARTRQSRPIVEIAVVKGDLEKMIKGSIPIENTIGLGLTKQIKTNKERLGTAINQSARQFLQKLSTPGIEPVAVCLELINSDSQKEESNSDSKPQKDQKPFVKISGLAAFNKDKLAGFINDRETRGWNWISEQKANGIINVLYPGNEGKVSINCKRTSVKIKPYFIDKKPQIKVELEVEGRIDTITGNSNIREKSYLTQSLENRMAEAIRNDIKLSLEKAKKLRTDIFGFGNSFYRLKYDKWKEIEKNWGETFVNLPVKIEVKTTIKRVGLINKSIF
ncbi:MAG: Ger(x)C family spore germination protein [Bacillota bacterium]